MAATRASGTNAVRYGTMKDNVLSLGVVTADGIVPAHRQPGEEIRGGLRSDAPVRRLGGHARRSSSRSRCGCRRPRGDRRRPLPVRQRARRLRRDDRDDPVGPAGRAHRVARRAAGQGVQRLFETRACRKRRCCSSSSTAARRASPNRRGASARSPREHGGGPFAWATQPEERSRLWQARHDAYWAATGLRPGARPFATDVCVPISRLADCVEETQRDIAEERPDRADRRPCRRRQLPRQPARRHERPRRDRARRALRRPPGASRHRHGRHLHRRARRRPEEDRLPRSRATPRRST